jgi:hypothetical protein
MKDEKITLATAKLCKEKNFDVAVFGSFVEYLKNQIDPEYPEGGGPFSMIKGEIEESNDYFQNNNEKRHDYTNKNYACYARPTQSLLLKWLREVHKLHIEIVLGHDEKETWYDFYVYKIELGYDGDFIADSCDMDGDNSYESCLEAALFNALKLI